MPSLDPGFKKTCNFNEAKVSPGKSNNANSKESLRDPREEKYF